MFGILEEKKTTNNNCEPRGGPNRENLMQIYT